MIMYKCNIHDKSIPMDNIKPSNHKDEKPLLIKILEEHGAKVQKTPPMEW